MSAKKPLIAPSILACDFALLRDECRAVLDAGADWLHVDVMDGHFVPNITIGLPVVRALRRHFPSAVLDVHLMIDDPDTFAVPFVEAGADIVSFHPEATHHPHRVIQAIRAAGGKAGLVLNPGTTIDWVDWLAGDLDLVLVMSVNPGFGGQAFIESAVDKVAALRARLDELGADCHLEIDGGVNVDNIGRIGAAGADVFVAGSAIFKSPSYSETIARMRGALG
jgi:ribulose-phosphate 3-epimerase